MLGSIIPRYLKVSTEQFTIHSANGVTLDVMTTATTTMTNDSSDLQSY